MAAGYYYYVQKAGDSVIAGKDGSNPYSYHAFLQEAVRDTMKHIGTIQRRYGYDLDLEQMVDNQFIKQRVYLRRR